MEKNTVDILIVGAGPSGLSAALALHALGKSVMIIDKHLSGLEFSRAILINRTTINALAPFNVAEKLISLALPLNSISIQDKQGNILHASHPTKTGLLLPQIFTEKTLIDKILENGIEVYRPAKLISFTQNSEHVEATIAMPNNEVLTVKCRYLIGADGVHSTTRETLGIPFNARTLDHKIFAIDCEMSWDEKSEAVVTLGDEGAFAAMKLSNNKVRLAGLSFTKDNIALKKYKPEAILWQSEFTVTFHSVKKMGEGRVWLAGDAAHAHSPIGGRGMNMGIQDGIALANAIHTGDFKSYEKERSKIAHRWVMINEIITRIAFAAGLRGKITRRFLAFVFRSINYKRITSRIFERIVH